MKKITLVITKENRPRERITWGFNPVTRKIPSKKVYSRKNYKIDY